MKKILQALILIPTLLMTFGCGKSGKLDRPEGSTYQFPGVYPAPHDPPSEPSDSHTQKDTKQKPSI